MARPSVPVIDYDELEDEVMPMDLKRVSADTSIDGTAAAASEEYVHAQRMVNHLLRREGALVVLREASV